MSYEKCPVCGEFAWFAGHRCPPEYTVSIEDAADMRVRASDPEQAAERAVDRWDSESSEYSCVSGRDVEVTVTDDFGIALRFEVSGESVPEYTARAI